MLTSNFGLTRRSFLQGTAATLGASALPLPVRAAQGTAKYRRYNAMSPAGQKALARYAKGVEALLKISAGHPQNWVRNALIHFMDCPHGNWWFYFWHRGYLGYFEQTIRNLSGDPTFAIPYWDWTTLPQIPDSMFTGVLTPQDMGFDQYTHNLAVFTDFMKTALNAHWDSLNAAQRAQLNTRGYSDFSKLWNDVTGYDPSQQAGISSNMAFSDTCNSRYLTRTNPKLDDKTAFDVSELIIYAALLPTDFHNPEPYLSFASSKTQSHNTPAGKNTAFSVLEGLPHNKIHNCIGGVGPLDPGPYGCMPNYLSSVDPIFFLHHSNMDRLWDVWTRKQKLLRLPYLPIGPDLQTLSSEPFLFYVNGDGNYVGTSQAGNYLTTDKFDYDYEPGFGEKITESESANARRTALHATPGVRGAVQANTASVVIPSASIKSHLASETESSLIAEITLPRPSPTSSMREFDVLVGAPASLTAAGADSPYYAGTVAFFGKTMDMDGMGATATFAIPLPKKAQAFHNFEATSNVSVEIRVVPSHGQHEKAPALSGAVVRIL